MQDEYPHSPHPLHILIQKWFQRQNINLTCAGCPYFLLPPHNEQSRQVIQEHPQGLYYGYYGTLLIYMQNQPGHQESMSCCKDMYLIYQNPWAPCMMVRVLDQDLPRVKLCLGTWATHNVLVQLNIVLLTRREDFSSWKTFRNLPTPQASLSSGNHNKSWSSTERT